MQEKVVMMSPYKIILSCVLLCSISIAHSEEDIPFKKGNLALSSSQQPGPLFAFGQNIIDKGDRQLFAYFDITKGIGKNYVEVEPSFLYGITNYASFFCSLPITDQKLGSKHSSGFEDLLLQFEYEFFTNTKKSSIDEATVVGSLILPTGSGSKNPNTGFGSPGFYFGATLSRTEIDWYYFASAGITATTTNNDRKFGDQCVLQCGVGRNIPSSSDIILMGLLELNGVFVQESKINGVIDGDMIAAILYLCPSIWFSSKKIIAQAGFAIPLCQHINNTQTIKNDFILAINFGVKF